MKNWKLKLHYNKIKTPYKHYQLFANGKNIAMDPEKYKNQSPNAYMALKCWAEDDKQAVSMMDKVAQSVGFEIKDKVEIYHNEPTQSPEKEPYAYDLNFHFYKTE